MSQFQTCPTCGAVNRVAGLYSCGLIDGQTVRLITCPFCGCVFQPQDGAILPVRQRPAEPVEVSALVG